MNYEIWKRKLVTDLNIMGGTTVFPNSRLTVQHVGGMVYRCAPREDILDDYPYLTPQDLVFAYRFFLEQNGEKL